MIPRMTINLRFCTLAVVAALSVAAGACGEKRTDVSGGVDELNSQISQRGAEMDCPDEVDGGAGATFDCTLRAKNGSKTADVKMKIVEEGEDLAVNFVNPTQFAKALETVAPQ